MSDESLKIRVYGAPVLRKVSESVTNIDSALLDLEDGMLDALYEYNGVGLAAPQVGVSRRMVIIDRSFGTEVDDTLTLINPQIISTEGSCIIEEGCLSVPKLYEDLERAEEIFVRYLDIDGNERELEADGFLARIILHEVDHLDGILFVDRLSTAQRVALTTQLRKISEENGAE